MHAAGLALRPKTINSHSTLKGGTARPTNCPDLGSGASCVHAMHPRQAAADEEASEQGRRTAGLVLLDTCVLIVLSIAEWEWCMQGPTSSRDSV